MILLRLLSLQYVRKHVLRSLLTVSGILLGVAVFVAMHTANQAVLQAFYRTIDRIAGSTQLQVSAGEPGFDEDVLEKVQAHPGVRVAVPVIEAVVATDLPGQGNLLILGVDMLGDRTLRDYDLEGQSADEVVEDPLVFLAQPDSLIVTNSFARQNGLSVNSKLPMQTMEGRRQFTVRGMMKAGGLASAFGGNLGVMDIYAAQQVFGRGRKFDRIDLAVKEGQPVQRVQRELQQALGPAFQVDSPQGRGAQFESVSRVYAVTANLTSLFALFIGMFLIYNTFAIAVTQRRSEIGILRALGATRGQVRTLFLMESAAAGLIGSVAGLLLGLTLARAIAVSISGLLTELYGTAQRIDEIAVDPWLIVAALGIGVITSVLAGWLPARQAAAIDPVKALQKGSAQMIGTGENRRRRWTALLLLAGSVLCLVLPQQGPALFYVGYLLAIVASVLVTPTATLWLTRLLRPLLRRLRPVEGTLAADSLIQAPRRTSGTVAALMLSLALVISLGGLSVASYRSIVEWMDMALNPDLFVATSESITARSFRFPASLGERIEAVPGVAEVHRVRTVRVPLEGSPVLLVALELDRLGRRVRTRVIAGQHEEMFRRAAAGEGVIIADNLANSRHLQAGQILDLPTPTGPLRLPILGIIADYSDQLGTIFLDRQVFRRYWNDDTVNLFRVYLLPGQSGETVKRDILAQAGGQRRLFVFTNGQLKAYILKLTDQWFGLTYIQIAVAVLVAVLGIVNALTVSITDRRRELGVLRAVGALRAQVRGTIWLEALCIGAVGLILGLGLGALALFYSLEMSRRDLGGFRLTYEYPVQLSLVLWPLILGVAFVAALGPAESAVRASLVEALEYE